MAKLSIFLVATAAVCAMGEVFFEETFNDDAWTDRWVLSEWKKGDMGKWDHSAGDWFADESEQKGIRTAENLKFYGISSKLAKPFSNKGKDLVVQFTVKHEKREYSFCGGGYIKLLPSTLDQVAFGGDSKYSVMFGPDLCGYDVSRVHVIFEHDGKNLLKKDEVKLEYADKNEYTHLYTLVVKPDNTYEVLFDQKSKATGKLVDGWDFPQPTIDDPKSTKPSDWVDEAEIPDPEDKKPEGYDDIPEQILDPEATKPEDWDDEDDGEWEAPLIDNPEYKGEWKQKMMANPEYKGEWSPDQIPNPDYVEDVYDYEDIGAVGFELWVVNNGSVYDNIIVTDSLEEANAFAEKTWKPFAEKEKEAKEAWDKANKEAEKEEEGDAEDDDDDVEDDDDDAEDDAEPSKGKDEL